jgi:hypothetical protein
MVEGLHSDESHLATRVSVLEAKVRLLSIVMKWLVGGLIVVLVGYIELKL